MGLRALPSQQISSSRRRPGPIHQRDGYRDIPVLGHQWVPAFAGMTELAGVTAHVLKPAIAALTRPSAAGAIEIDLSPALRSASRCFGSLAMSPHRLTGMPRSLP